jgi:hypothetical protein
LVSFLKKSLNLLSGGAGGSCGAGGAVGIDSFRLEERLGFVEGLRVEGRGENCLLSMTLISARLCCSLQITRTGQLTSIHCPAAVIGGILL